MMNTTLARRTGVLATLMLLTAFIPPTVAQDWYPLYEGASWNYSSPHFEVTVTVEAQTELLGQQVWPVVYDVAEDGGLDYVGTHYTLVNDVGGIVRIASTLASGIGWLEFVPPWLFLQLPPVVGDSWVGGWDQSIFHPYDKVLHDVTWLSEEDVTMPAGTFHVFNCEGLSVAAGVGVVRMYMSGIASDEWVELVSYDVPVRTEATSLSGVKDLFR